MKYDEKYPITLRNSSYFTKLIVLNAHEEVMHSGIEATLAIIRSSYWLMKGRRTVKGILRKCVTCKKMQGRPLLPPPSPDFPEFRVNMSQSFQTTGLDFAGPLSVNDTVGKGDIYNVHILLLTWETSRELFI